MVVMTKKLKDYLQLEGVYEQAVKNTMEYDPFYRYKFLASLFDWKISAEGYEFWEKLSDKQPY